MEYLLKVTAVVTIFYTIYKLFLQRDTFFESNRWFLIIGLISSLVIPFLVIPIYIEYTPTFYNITVTEQVSTEIVEKPFNILDYLPLFYGLGVVFFSARFFIQLYSLIKIIYRNSGIKKDGFVFIETQNNTSPFSFFKWIVYNPETFSQTELEHIIEHEKTHAKQYHSIDILTTQLFCVLLWFNPFMWLYNKDLKQNLEFIADKRTLNQYNCKKSYQYTLLKTSMPSHQMALSNHFYNSLTRLNVLGYKFTFIGQNGQVKKRIVMLHKSKSKKINQLKYVLVIPALLVFLLSCNSEVINNETEKELKTNPITKIGYKISDLEKDQQPLFVLNGKEISMEEMNAIIPDSIKSVNVIKNETGIKKYGDKAKNGVIEISTEWETKFVFGKSFEDVKVIGHEIKSDAKYTIRASFPINGEKQTIVVDGKIASKEELGKLTKDKIESMNVLKNETASKKYGDIGKNVVIEITTKK